MSGIDVTALDFSRIKGNLYGRSEELSALRQGYLRTFSTAAEIAQCDDEGAGGVRRNSEAVLVSGQSGTGKSSIVERALRDDPPIIKSADAATTTSRHFFVSGKFDQRQQAEPYSGVSAAFTELCNLILSDDDCKFRSAMIASIKEAIGPEGTAIANVVPNLIKMFQQQEQEQQQNPTKLSAEAPSSTTNAQHRFRYAFRAFVRAVCSKSHLVLFLDDLQWADGASLDLLQSLLTDPESSNLLFVGSYRSEEVGILDDSHHPLAVRWREVEKRRAVKMSRIHIESLDKGSVNALISDLLRLDPDHTLSLTDVVYRKTDGNIFFVLRFLEALQEGGLLFLSLHTLKWNWAKTEEIEATMGVADNVVDLVTAKLRRLPGRVRNTVSLAACLGCQFSTNMLETVIGVYDDDADTNPANNDDSQLDYVVVVLEVATREGIIEMAATGVQSRGSFRFVHDRIQQAAYSLLPTSHEDRDLLHVRIGDRLFQKLASTEKAGERRDMRLMFVVVNQLNHGLDGITDIKKRIALAKLNLQLGECAAASSAFVPAAEYLSMGIDLLKGTDAWNSNYDMCLRIYNASAEIEECIGNLEKCRRLSDEVLENASSLCDKARAYRVIIDSLVAQTKFAEALQLGFKVLSLTGERFPRSVYLPHVAVDLLKTKRTLRGMTEEDILNLPRMANDTKYTAIRTMVQMMPSAVILNSSHVPLLIFRTVQLTIKHGLCKLSPVACSLYAMLLCGMGDLNGGYRVGKLALALQESCGDAEFYALTMHVLHEFIFHWKDPLSQSLESLLKSYEVGMRSGDIRAAMISAKCYCAHYIYSGIGPLGPIEKDLREYCERMVEHGEEAPLLAFLPLRQFVLNLMGQSDDPLILTGEAMNEAIMLERALGEKTVVNIYHLNALKMELAYLFGHVESAATFAQASWTQQLSNKTQKMTHFELCRCVFIDCLVSLALARTTRHKKWLRRARKLMKQMRKWVKCGAGNIVHMLLLLEAEIASLEGKKKTVKQAFDAAIAAASRSGFRHDHALANERAGLFFLAIKDDYWPSFYLSKSHELWNDWGAKAKAAQLLQNHANDGITTTDTLEFSRAHKGRSRFVKLSVMHKSLSIDNIGDAGV